VFDSGRSMAAPGCRFKYIASGHWHVGPIVRMILTDSGGRMARRR